MKKTTFYFSVMLTLVALHACNEKDNKEPQNDPQKEMLTAVDALITSGGTLQTTAAKNEETIISRDTAAIIMYTDPLQEFETYSAYPVKTKRHYSMVDNPEKFATLDPWDMLWPGALIQGASIRNGVPTSIPIFNKRLPGKVYLSRVTGASDVQWAKEVPMRGSDVTQAMNEILATYLGNFTPAHTSFEVESVSSIEEVALKTGINLSLFGVKLQASFGKSWSSQKSYVLVKLNQIFYTMTYDGPDGGFSGVFTNDITTDDLKNYTGPGNPICYVASVSYGRSFILLYESEESQKKLEKALTAAYKEQGGGITPEDKTIVNTSKCKLIQLGGNPETGLEASFGDFEKIRQFVEKEAKVSVDNPGAPISYKIVHLKDNSPACLSNTLEYDVTTTEYLKVEPENDIIIDIFNAKMERPKTNWKLSNHSRIQIKELYVSRGPADNITKTPLLRPFNGTSLGTCGGIDISIYNTYKLRRMSTNDRIRIYCKLYIKNQTYGGSTKIGEEDITLLQDFEYNADLGKWTPINKKEGRPFEALTVAKRIGDATIDFALTYRFSCDGRVYSYSEDGE